MKCRALLVMGTRTRGGKARPVIRDYVSRVALDQGLAPAPDGSVECGGRIGVVIGAELEGSNENPYAEFQLEYPCERCGCRTHPGLPDVHSVGSWLEGIIAALPDAPAR